MVKARAESLAPAKDLHVTIGSTAGSWSKVNEVTSPASRFFRGILAMTGSPHACNTTDWSMENAAAYKVCIQILWQCTVRCLMPLSILTWIPSEPLHDLRGACLYPCTIRSALAFARKSLPHLLRPLPKWTDFLVLFSVFETRWCLVERIRSPDLLIEPSVPSHDSGLQHAILDRCTPLNQLLLKHDQTFMLATPLKCK